jgi:hypothetical protein
LRLEDWLYSNYRDWVSLRFGTLKDQDFIMDHFSSPAKYAAFCNDLSAGFDKEVNS